MNISRTEIMDGVALNYLQSFKFKTACMSVSMLTQLSRETAAMNALIPFVLRRGTVGYPDMDAVSARLDELYGTAVEPLVRRMGEIQCIGLMYDQFVWRKTLFQISGQISIQFDNIKPFQMREQFLGHGAKAWSDFKHAIRFAWCDGIDDGIQDGRIFQEVLAESFARNMFHVRCPV